MVKKYQYRKPYKRCMKTIIDKHGNKRTCKHIAQNDSNYCFIHNKIPKSDIGKCCFCGDECNQCSQSCGRCARGFTWSCIGGV